MIVEAMKTMNHAPTSNGVVKDSAEDGQPVEFGQT